MVLFKTCPFLGLFFDSHKLNFLFHFFKYLGMLISYILCTIIRKSGLCGLDFAIFRLSEELLTRVALFSPHSFIFNCLHLLNFIWGIT